MTERTKCCVPFCRRTTSATYAEWICGQHWRLVPAKMRAVKHRNGRELRRAIAADPLVAEYWKMPPGSAQRLAAVSLWRQHDRIWARCKRAAIEHAGGL